ncbi:MAG TPA: glycosyltransferase [Terriglobales bacterium]|nr:glycosyltransferase [Terriglobales bacterium]
MRLTAVVPTYNEVDNLTPLVAELLGLDLPDIDLRVLVVDDASPDGTGRLADQLAERAEGRVDVLHRPAKGGLSSAYTEGFARALAGGADLIAQLDADLSHQPSVLPNYRPCARRCGERIW